MKNENETRERIVLASMGLFFAQGIKKTSVDEVAMHAGVTRITVYRYFADKESLVHAVFMRIVAVFQQVEVDLENQTHSDIIESSLDRIGHGLAILPKGDFPARLEELQQLYPALWTKFRETRIAVVSRIFDRLFEAAQAQGRLREAISRPVAQAFFMEAVVNVLDSPLLQDLNLTSEQVYTAVKSIFLYGILKGEQ